MRIVKKVVTTAVAALSIAGGAAARADVFGFGVEGRSWFMDFEGKIGVDAPGLTGTKIDADDDLEMDTSKNIAEVEAWIEFLSNRINFSVMDIRSKGEKRITQQINYKGKTFQVSDTVSSEIDLSIIDATFERPIPFVGEWGPVSVNLLLGAKYIDFSGELKSAALGTIEESDKAPIPEIGASIRIDLGDLEAYAGAKGLSVNTTDVDGKMIDARASVGYTLWNLVTLHGGYRHLSIDIEADDSELDLKFAGPYLGASISF